MITCKDPRPREASSSFREPENKLTAAGCGTSIDECVANQPWSAKPNLMVHAQSSFHFNAERATAEPKMRFETLEVLLL
jgi:hypothetical protein